MFHGKLDRLVPPDHASEYYEALRQQGILTELKMLPLRGHVTSFVFRGSSVRVADKFIETSLKLHHRHKALSIK